MVQLKLVNGSFGSKPGVYIGDIMNLKLQTMTDYSGKTWRAHLSVQADDGLGSTLINTYFSGTINDNKINIQPGAAYIQQLNNALTKYRYRGYERQYLKGTLTLGTIHNGDISNPAIEELDTFDFYYLANTDNNSGIFYSTQLMDTVNADPSGNGYLIRYMSTAYFRIKALSFKTDFTNAIINHNGENYTTAEFELYNMANGSDTAASTLDASIRVLDVESNTFSFRLVTNDNRYWVSDAVRTQYFVPYSKLTCHNPSIRRFEGNLALFTVDGTFYNNTATEFAAFNKLTLQYRYGTYQNSLGDWITLTPEINGNSFLVYTQALPENGEFYIQCRAYDKLMNVVTDVIRAVKTPTFDWNKSEFNFYVPVRVKSQDGLNTPKLNSTEVTATKVNSTNVTAGQVYTTKHYMSGETGNVPTIQKEVDILTIGQDGYNSEVGSTKLYGNEVDIFSHNGTTVQGNVDVRGTLMVNGRDILTNPENVILWDAASPASPGTNLGELRNGQPFGFNNSATISQQRNGVVFVFTQYDYSTKTYSNASVHTFFVSKKEVELLGGAPHTFLMSSGADFSTIGAKYVYIYNDYIDGHESNLTTGNGSGITFNNQKFALRYVIGV